MGMGFFKDFDTGDAAFFIMLTTMTSLVALGVLSLFKSDVTANPFLMLLAGKFMAILDAGVLMFFHAKIGRAQAVAAEEVEFTPSQVETVAAKVETVMQKPVAEKIDILTAKVESLLDKKKLV